MNSSIRSAAIAALGASLLLVPALPGALAETPASVVAPAKKRHTQSVSTCAATAITPGAGSRAKYVWKRLRNAGYSPAASAGVISYLDQVSAIAPQAINRTQKRVGLAQWPQTRWAAYVAHTEKRHQNRWSFKKQVNFLLFEMSAGALNFNNAKFKVRVNPRKAARVFNRTFNPISADVKASKAPLSIKAAGWFQSLGPSRLSTKSDVVTYGSRSPCAPPNVSLDRCPMVPDSFKDYFANFTGFKWDHMSDSAQLMSRCAYNHFPYIKSHGTYNGHMPVWSQAIDFMMPNGCVNGSGGSRTRSRTDLKVGSRLARYLFMNAHRLNIDYLIWQDSLRNPGERSYENEWVPISHWRNDSYNNGDCTNTHFDHVHVSVYSDVVSASTPTPALNPDGEPW